MTSGIGLYFDGVTSARHSVTVEAAPDALHIRGPDGAPIATWPYDSLRSMSAPDDILRLGRADDPSLARLEIRDTTLIAIIDDYAASTAPARPSAAAACASLRGASPPRHRLCWSPSSAFRFWPTASQR
jgi:hypothetical protein